jgi:nitrate reductase gamma subunit
MYALAIGPLLWISVALFFGGLVFRVLRLFRLTERKAVMLCQVTKTKDAEPAPTVSAVERKLDLIARFQNSVVGKHPVMTVVSTIFHVCLVGAPVFLMAHNLMLRNGLGIRLPSLPDGMADFLTVVVLACAVFFLVRRLAVPKVAAISSANDYAVLAITAAPFLTGFMAHHQLLDYRTLLTAHILTGELMLIAIPFTKIGHMVFFFFSRLTMAGEFCLGRGQRTWAMEARVPAQPERAA